MLNLTIHIVNNDGKFTGWISGIKGVIDALLNPK